MKDNLIITINREFGSGGRYIGKMLAEELGIPFYDRELIELACEKSGMSEKVVESVDETVNKFFYSFRFSAGAESMFDLSMNDKVFMLQSDVIKNLAAEGSCVFIGRCADYILENSGYKLLKVFIHQNMDGKKERAVTQYNIPEDRAESIIIKTNKRRAAYYNYYTNKKWGSVSNYDLCVNSGAGIEKCVRLIKTLADG